MLLDVLLDRFSDDPLDNSWFRLLGKLLQDISNNLLDILRLDVFGRVFFGFRFILWPVLEDLGHLFGVNNLLWLLGLPRLVVSKQIFHDVWEIITRLVLGMLRDIFFFNSRDDFLHGFRSLLGFTTEDFRDFLNDFFDFLWLNTLRRFVFGLNHTILLDNFCDRLGDTWPLWLLPLWLSPFGLSSLR